MLALFALGAAQDLWRARAPVPASAPADRVTVAPPAAGNLPLAGASPAGAPVDLNRAGVAELDALPGIGPVIAGRIVEHRARYGPFRSAEDLLAVRGIGPALLSRLRARVTVAPGPGAETPQEKGPPAGGGGPTVPERRGPGPGS